MTSCRRCCRTWACTASSRAVLCLLLLAGLGLGLPARANGRFPAAGQIAANPADPAHLVVRATYGLLQTTDAGKTWQWLCESAVGYEGQQDPFLGVLADGTTVAATAQGLSVSHDRGCQWDMPPGSPGALPAIDLVVVPGQPGRVVALVETRPPDEPGQQGLVQSLDSGQTWQALGVPLPADVSGLTLEVAPSQPTRLYVSGRAGDQGAILRSDDAGATWQRFDVDLQGALGDYLAAVDPTDPDRVYLRRDRDEGDELRLSTDGGQTWQKAWGGPGNLLGFALSPDGSQVALGYTGGARGVWVAAAQSLAFAKRAVVGARCLTWTPAGLYACASEGADGFTVGLSKDAGHTFQALHHQPELEPLQCPAGTRTAAICPNYWPLVALQIGVPEDEQPEPRRDEGMCAARPKGALGGVAAAMLAAWGVWLVRRRRGA